MVGGQGGLKRRRKDDGRRQKAGECSDAVKHGVSGGEWLMLLFVNEDVAQVHEFGLGVLASTLIHFALVPSGAVTTHSLDMLSVEARGNQVAPSVEVETSIFSCGLHCRCAW